MAVHSGPSTQDTLVGFQAKAKVEGDSHLEVLEAVVEVANSHQAVQAGKAVDVVAENEEVVEESTPTGPENCQEMVGVRAVSVAVGTHQGALVASEEADYTAGSHLQEHLTSKVVANEACRCSTAD